MSDPRSRADGASGRMPTVFLPHGGGPWPFINPSMFGAPDMWTRMRAYMEQLGRVPPAAPRALLVVSAHWESPIPTVQTAPSPAMLYDYYGFEPAAYEIQWPAPGAPDVADAVQQRLQGAGIESAADPNRGFDHGVFVPMKLAYPDADVPTLQLSLQRDLDPAVHLEIGRALAPLRDEGVFIVGSGMSYHNLPAFRAHMKGQATGIETDSKAFDEWLAESMALESSARQGRLIEWSDAPAARQSHPREEHLLPLMVVAGAAGESKATLPYRDRVMGAHVSAVHFE